MPQPDSDPAGARHHNPCTFTLPTGPPLIAFASALSGLTWSTEVSTTSKLPPATDFSSSSTVSGHAVSETPWKYQLLPPSASTSPYFLNARRITWVRGSKCEMSNEALRRKRAPIGGRDELVLLPELWRAGQRYSMPFALRPQMAEAVKRIAWSIEPAATSSQRTRPGKMGSPAASAEVHVAGRSAFER